MMPFELFHLWHSPPDFNRATSDRDVGFFHKFVYNSIFTCQEKKYD